MSSKSTNRPLQRFSRMIRDFLVDIRIGICTSLVEGVTIQHTSLIITDVLSSTADFTNYHRYDLL